MATEKQYTVITPLVIAKTSNGDRYLYGDVSVPTGDLLEGEVERLLEGGFIALVVTIPEGDPSDDWSMEELKLFATQTGVDFGSGRTKGDVLKAIEKSKSDAEAAAKAAADAAK